MSGSLAIAPIVEGHGDAAALPVLLRRLCSQIDPTRPIEIRKPSRVGRAKVVKPGELERYVELAARRAGSGGCVLVVLDADDDCPAILGPELLDRARAIRPGLRMAVVLANSEFEAWFLAAAESLAGRRGLRQDLTAPSDPEAVRDAKGWLQQRREDRFAYGPSTDQPALAAHVDLGAARAASPSFDKLWRDVAYLMGVAISD